MPQLKELLQAAGLQTGEYAQLFYARRAALDWVASESSLFGSVPVRDRRGFRARVKILGRDKDGSLCAEVRVTAPNYPGEHVRKIRLVKNRRLIYS
jgi:hypothetical protein